MAYIAVDFDGTCVSHLFDKEDPSVHGKDIGAIPVLKELTEQGHKLIIFTLRSEDYLSTAIKWFNDNEIPYYSVNRNPVQYHWSKSLKVYADLYIDDAGLGIPLKYDESISERPFVDWIKVRELLVERKFLKL